MKVGILGTGVVGKAIGTRLTGLGHEVKMGSRTANNEKAAAWVNAAGKGASQGTFADAARFGEVLFNCTSGGASLEALKAAGKDNLGSKVLVDVSNPLDFSKGMPPSLSVCNTDSNAEQIQRAYPDLKVVKSLNTMNCDIMVNPSRVPGDHNVFVAGNDAAAKAKVKEILGSFGWTAASIIDVGGITGARGLEMILPLWLSLWGAFQNPNFNFHLAQGPSHRSKPVFVILWEFLPAPGREADFERAYGHDGDWARFFQRDSKYLGTELLRDTRDPRRFITVDRWQDQASFDAFAERNAKAYREMDERLAPLSQSETPIASFTTP